VEADRRILDEVEAEVDDLMVVRPLRAPWVAGVAGLLFAVLFTAALALLRTLPIESETDEDIAAWFASGQDTPALIAGLFLAPFAGVAFLWFIAVVRDQVGEREDKFFATAFFGSGVLFVALLFVTAGIASSIFVGPRYLGQPPPTAATVAFVQALSYSLMFAFATRAAALFILATATVGRLTGVFPRWFSALGYVSGLLLLLTVSFFDWIVLVLPVWVAIVSVFILRRERARRRGTTP
jgi:hypothetical protein